jgi:hypothetical protein
MAGNSIALPGTGDPTFFVTFVLPRDYKKDGTAKA